MLVTELGMVMEVKLEQLQKTRLPMLVTELGMVMEVRPRQPQKASSPMLVTELGMVMEVRLELTNAPTPIVVTELGIIVFWHPAINTLSAVVIIALQLLRES